MVTLNASQILLNEPYQLWPVWWDFGKCIQAIREMEQAGFGPSYYMRFQATPPNQRFEPTPDSEQINSSGETEIPF